MTTPLATLRGLIAEMLGDNLIGSLTSNGVSGGTTIVDTKLSNEYSQNDEPNSLWILLTSGTYKDIQRKISAFTQSSGTATVPSSFGGQVLSGVTYEIHRYRPSLYTEAINQAIRELSPHILWKELRDETLIACNALPNGNFEDWAEATYPDYWRVSVCTAAKETSAGNYRYGKASMKLTGGASSGYAYCDETLWLALLDLQGISVTYPFTVWVKTNTASHCRLAVVDDDGTSYSSYHTGGNAWEKLTVSRTIKSDTKSLSFRIYADVDAAVAYVDQAVGENSHNYLLVLPSDFQAYNPSQIDRQISGGSHSATALEAPDALNDVYPFENLYPGRHYQIDNIEGGPRVLRLQFAGGQYKLRLLGKAPLSTFTTTAALPAGTGTATSEIDSPKAQLLATHGAAILMTKIAAEASGEEVARYHNLATALFNRSRGLVSVHGMLNPPVRIPRI